VLCFGTGIFVAGLIVAIGNGLLNRRWAASRPVFDEA
jgi:hypothetical protein